MSPEATKFKLSWRKTKLWRGWAAYDGSLVKIYLPRWYSDFIESGWEPPEWVQPGFTDDAAWTEFIHPMCLYLAWDLTHEAIHTIGIRHTNKWRSIDPP